MAEYLPGYYVTGVVVQNNNASSSNTWVTTSSWGNMNKRVSNIIFQGLSWSSNYNWGNTLHTLYLSKKLDDGETGYFIVGGSQSANNDNSSAAWVTASSWGKQSGTSVNIGSIKTWTPKYNWGNSNVYLNVIAGRKSAPPSDAYLLVGGEQRFSTENSASPFVTEFKWGTGVNTFNNCIQQKVAEGTAWSSKYGWGNSMVYLNLIPANN